jgi:hypothetical protein
MITPTICRMVILPLTSITIFAVAPVTRADNSGTSALYAVDAYASDDVWAVGYKYEGDLSFPLVEHWDGTRWSIIPNPPDVSQSQMHGVTVVAPDDVWIVGATWNVSDLAYALHWDGISLQVATVVNPGFYGGFWAVAAGSFGDVWAVGTTTNRYNDYNTLTEHWDGTSWRVVPSPTGTYDFLQGVSIVSPDDVWAVGYGLTAAEILHWDGTRWTFSDSGAVGNYAGYRAVAATSTNDAWAVGFGSGGLVEHWDGTAWRRVQTPIANFFGIGAIASDDMWTVGQIGISPRHTFAMHWDGVSWTTFSTPSPGRGINANILNAVDGVDSNDVWAVGIGQQALTLHWDGQRWRRVPNPGENVR